MNLDLSQPSKERVEILATADPFEVTSFRDSNRDMTILRLFADAGAHGSWHADARIDDSVMLRANPLRDILLSVEATKEQLHEYLYEALGDYPFARFWMMRHLKIDLKNNKQVPGFAWARFSKAHPGKVALRDKFELVDKDESVTTTKPKRKVNIVKPEVKKPPRKPKCPLHSVEMKYETLRGVWACKEEGCKQIALPKRDRIEGQLLLGKGKVGVRLVYPDKNEPPRLVLISDDNVALDITELVTEPVQELIEEQAVDDAIDDARRSAVQEVAVKRFSFAVRSTATVMGIEHAP